MPNTPNLKDKVPQGTGQYTVGTEIEAGLPNIIGEVGLTGWSNYVTHPGVFRPKTIFYDSLRGDGGQGQVWSFDASRCSSIYRNDITTVQPPALAVNFYIKAK